MPQSSPSDALAALCASADLLPHALWVADASGAVTYVNARWAELVDAAGGDARGDGWLGYVAEPEHAAAAYAEAIAQGAPFVLDATLRLPWGTAAARLLARPHRDAAGGLVAWVGSWVVLDVVAEAPRPDAGQTARARVLVVEDNKDAQYILRRILERDYDIVCAEDADQALAAAHATTFDTVLIDIHLDGGANGLQLLEALRALPAYADTPMAAVTAYGIRRDRDPFISAGFAHFVIKPFTATEIRQVVRDMLDGGR